MLMQCHACAADVTQMARLAPHSCAHHFRYCVSKYLVVDIVKVDVGNDLVTEMLKAFGAAFPTCRSLREYHKLDDASVVAVVSEGGFNDLGCAIEQMLMVGSTTREYVYIYITEACDADAGGDA